MAAANEADSAAKSIKADTEFQSSSGIELSELNDRQTTDLVLLGQIWAFLKYHHPEVAGGAYHWDYELFRIMPKVLAATSREDRNKKIAAWIMGLGAIEKCDPCTQKPEKPIFAAELAWLSDSAVLGEELSVLLIRVHENRYAGRQQAYVRLAPNIGNPQFLNEQRYADMSDLDAGYRILGLLRYWGMIEYWFPYRDVIGRDWQEVLPQYLPQIARAKNDAEYRQVMMRAIAEVNDSHAFWYHEKDSTPPAGKCQGPFHLRTIGDSFVVSGYRIANGAEDSVVQKGDVIAAVDGRPVMELVKELMPFYAASNRAGKFRNIAARLLAGPCGPASLTVDRSGRHLDMVFERVELKNLAWQQRTLPGDVFQMIGDDIAYVTFKQHGDKQPASTDANAQAASFMEKAMDRQGIIFDLRTYPGFQVVDTIAKYLSPKPRPFVQFSKIDIQNPGYAVPFVALSVGGGRDHAYKGKVVILVDETTQSAAEYHAMKLQAVSDATIMGVPTAGADGNISRFVLPGGIVTGISGIGVYYPDWSPTQRIGIQPDIFIEPTVQGIAQGRDEVLERAKQYIREQ
ncbi:S41 family peptidase [Sphingorhabdus sp. Alg239-R122]|uniref:S41 family peptidase n=1 Tax=Sphingorhabdus sp. Alg239-R122 TaxID=2305989 RepID=UPI001966E3B1|nr:S41 family peptidase [Sphingorhabdus sp. Alg239-R122]